MTTTTINRLIAKIAPQGHATRESIEQNYPDRPLSPEAFVTRIAPSPTGFVHIGTIYMALINERLAHQTGGVFYLRIEDTDTAREVQGGKEMTVSALDHFKLSPDEGLQVSGEETGNYAPYTQSKRAEIYASYAIDLLRTGWAYPCFAGSEELQENVAKQQSAKLRPGYYGEWAVWRDRSDEDINAALDQGKQFVLRFRSRGKHTSKISFTDAIRGQLEMAQNDLDVPLLKNNGLPTYHFAHVVDDHLMRTNLVVRGEEWLPSTPLHLEIAEALAVPPFRYCHLGVISINDGASKRKLSKRKDPQANITFFAEAGYPVEAIKAYLLGLANSNFEDWFRTHTDAPLETFELSLQKLAQSRSPLLDMKKLDDISRDLIGRMTQEEYAAGIYTWSKQYDSEFYDLLVDNPDYTSEVLAIERDGEQKRKDIAKWSDAPDQYRYFFETPQQQSIHHELQDIDVSSQNAIVENFIETYDPDDDRDVWFGKVKYVAEVCGFAKEMKDYKASPDEFKGSVADVARVLRVKLTGKNRSPDLWTVMQVMGLERVTERLRNN